jgi:hypothetical protein
MRRVFACRERRRSRRLRHVADGAPVVHESGEQRVDAHIAAIPTAYLLLMSESSSVSRMRVQASASQVP